MVREVNALEVYCEDYSGQGVSIVSPYYHLEFVFLNLVFTKGLFACKKYEQPLFDTTKDHKFIIFEEFDIRKDNLEWTKQLLSGDVCYVTLNVNIVMREFVLMLFQKNPHDFKRRFVTVDETWIHHYTPETKEQSKQWVTKGESAPKKGEDRSFGRKDYGDCLLGFARNNPHRLSGKG
uniref:Uncharacterized protein n=1 Tax=Rhodnius prolixus TaxID=13249 RepID=T1HW85_RHOPR